MLDSELHQHYALLLGITSPWKVASVDLNTAQKYVEIRIIWPSGVPVVCPECGTSCPIRDHLEERTWRHLDTMQFETRVRCRVPRSDCKEHGVKSVKVPWAEAGSRFTRLFEKFVIDVLRSSSSVSAAAGLLGLSWDQIHRIMQRAVERGLERRDLDTVEYVGMDEKSFGAGQSYVSMLRDLESGRVREVMLGRDREAADFLWESLTEEQRAQIVAVALDMAAFYVQSAQEYAPQADIVHDKFHIARQLNDAVAKVFRQENRALQKQGDEQLKGQRPVWLVNPERWKPEQQASFEALKKRTLKVSRAWAIKELFTDFWTYCYAGSARKLFKRWFAWASRSQLKPIIKVARTLRNHLDNILTYLKHQITNSVTEGLNSKMQLLKSNARGFRSFFNYRTRILFYCGKLDLYPH